MGTDSTLTVELIVFNSYENRRAKANTCANALRGYPLSRESFIPLFPYEEIVSLGCIKTILVSQRSSRVPSTVAEAVWCIFRLLAATHIKYTIYRSRKPNRLIFSSDVRAVTPRLTLTQSAAAPLVAFSCFDVYRIRPIS